MDAPPEKKESNTISMVVEKWAEGQTEQFSAVHRINGNPLRLRIGRRRDDTTVTMNLFCDKSNEADLWKCTATVRMPLLSSPLGFDFCSWKKQSSLGVTIPLKVGSSVQITVTTEEDGNSWNSRPPLDSINPPNGILVIGEEKKEIQVNKEFLASQSPYFDRLFFANFKEKDMDKIPIGAVEYEEFDNIIKMVYGSSEADLSDENVYGVLDLADRFELKIVEDKVVSFLLSAKTSFSLAQKFLISQESDIPFLKNELLRRSGLSELGYVKKAPEYADFSDAMKLDILDEVLDLAQEAD